MIYFPGTLCHLQNEGVCLILSINKQLHMFDHTHVIILLDKLQIVMINECFETIRNCEEI